MIAFMGEIGQNTSSLHQSAYNIQLQFLGKQKPMFQIRLYLTKKQNPNRTNHGENS